MSAHRPNFRRILDPIIRAAGVRATARRSGVDHTSLVRWLAGRSNITSDSLEAVLVALGLGIQLAPIVAESSGDLENIDPP